MHSKKQQIIFYTEFFFEEIVLCEMIEKKSTIQNFRIKISVRM